MSIAIAIPAATIPVVARHLLYANEILAHRLLSIHNLRVYLKLMEDIRKSLRENRRANFTDPGPADSTIRRSQMVVNVGSAPEYENQTMVGLSRSERA